MNDYDEMSLDAPLAKEDERPPKGVQQQRVGVSPKTALLHRVALPAQTGRVLAPELNSGDSPLGMREEGE